MKGIDHCKEIIFGGENLILSPLLAAFWPAQKMLILADLHLGKSAYFRKNGIAVPSTVMIDDLKRLLLLIQEFNAETILVAGDMFHHNYNADISIFKKWRSENDLIKILLVPGNHDKLLEINYRDLNITLTAGRHFINPFFFEHETKNISNENLHISGHIHPGYLMEGKARQSLRLPCFIQTEQQLILPAFSSFTGLHTKHEAMAPGTFYVVGGEQIFCV